ncbi:MAG: pyridoxal phosphate-dependent aminotransferase [Nitrososphaerota archaeon]|nr:pyridoxal phosphate-dependent aminotransferase [Nitrososphaerota archaeon]
MWTSKRMERIKPSGTIAMAEKSRQMERSGVKVYHLDVGEPDFDTPEHIKEAAVEALRNGFTHYTSSRGILELREAISEDLKARGLEADPAKEIIVTPGGKHAIYCACLATLNPNEEVLVLAPTWPTHFQCVEMAEARPIEVPCGQDYRLDEEILKSCITKKTRMILISSPNNPTGGLLEIGDLKVIADLSIDYDLLVLSDEIYDRIVYDDLKIRSIASFDGMKDRTIVINGFSKTYAMTGWRLGYACAHRDIIEAMDRIQQSTTTCPASFVQKAGVAALKGPQDSVTRMIREYDYRRRFIVDVLNSIPGVHCVMPRGAFYVFPDFSRLRIPSYELSNRLLLEEKVSTTPGIEFGKCGEGHIRLSYAVGLDVIGEALKRIKEFVIRCQKN